MRLIDLLEGDEDHQAALEKTGFWGKQGAGVIFFARTTNRFCISLRSEMVTEPRTWSTWGGAIDDGEDPLEAAVREAHEETKLDLSIDKMDLLHINIFPGKFKYTTFLAIVENEFKPIVSGNWEVDGYEWCSFGDWPSPLHHGMEATLNDSAAKAKMEKWSSHS